MWVGPVLGTTLAGINFVVTILRMRAPGMNLMKMPVFTWTALITNILIVAIFPVLTATLAMLILEEAEVARERSHRQSPVPILRPVLLSILGVGGDQPPDVPIGRDGPPEGHPA